MERQSVTVTTDASGDGTGTTSQTLNGRLAGVQYVKTNYADTADFTITTVTHTQSLLTAANVTASAAWHPRQATHAAADASASLYAAGGEPVESDIPIAGDRVLVTVAQGGDTKTGTFHSWVG